MALHIGAATLKINTFIGDPYVANDYVALDYVEGGVVAIKVKLGTILTIAGATITANGTRIQHGTANLSITSAINMGTNVFDIEASTFNTFIVEEETRLNTVQQETRVFEIA
tara:strand:- start:307 stop:642 length:336 start_codon:yes stop_codon:yes gene_type:complete